MNTRPDHIQQNNTGFDSETGARLAPQYRPLLLKIWLAGTIIAFAALEFCIHHRNEALRAAGYSYWPAANYYIRFVPGHLLSLTQAQSHIEIAIAAACAGLFTAALIGCIITPKPIFTDLNNVSSYSYRKPLLRGRARKLLFAFPPLIVAGICGLMGLKIINTLTVDLDQNLITSPPGAGNYCLELSNVTDFEAVMETTSDGTSSHWEVIGRRVEGHYFVLLYMELDFSNDRQVAGLIATALTDFVSSNGQNLPPH